MIKIRWRRVVPGLLFLLLVWYAFLLTRIYAYSLQFEKLVHGHPSLAKDGAEGAWIQVAGMHRHCNQQVAPFELEVAAALADFVETGLFQGRNHLAGLEDWQFRHRHGQ